jgi:hypothetical protein
VREVESWCVLVEMCWVSVFSVQREATQWEKQLKGTNFVVDYVHLSKMQITQLNFNKILRKYVRLSQSKPYTNIHHTFCSVLIPVHYQLHTETVATTNKNDNTSKINNEKFYPSKLTLEQVVFFCFYQPYI